MNVPVDRLGRRMRDLRVSVTDRCNFRCPYCMPAEIYGEKFEFLAREELLRFEEIERLVRIFTALGVEKLRITGGEPLLRHGIADLVARLARIEALREITLTTNGYLLARHARALAGAGLDRVTVSLDGHDDATCRRMNGVAVGIAPVLEGIEAALAAGLTPLKVNCVVERGANEHSILPLVRRFKGTSVILRFIEFMDVGTLNRWNLARVVPAAEILARIGAEFPLEPADPNYPGEVARRWRFADGSGEIGVIASVSAPFCGDCTRARLTIDGRLLTCLFAAGGSDLRAPLREGVGDDEVRARIESVWRARSDRYSELRAGRSDAAGQGPGGNRLEMYQVGG